jgi:hypothetical protein
MMNQELENDFQKIDGQEEEGEEGEEQKLN